MTLIDTPLDPKRNRILEGALKVFLAYGFTRTTMDDIAKAAEMSRPALYLLFKNKTDIYRAIAAMMLASSIKQAGVALAGQGDFADRLFRAIDEGLISMMALIAGSPHGAEILDMKNTLCGDLAADWRQGLGDQIAGAIAAEAARTGVNLAARGFTVNQLSDLLLDGLEGMKARLSRPEDQRTAAQGLVRVIELAIRP